MLGDEADDVVQNGDGLLVGHLMLFAELNRQLAGADGFGLRSGFGGFCHVFFLSVTNQNEPYFSAFLQRVVRLLPD
jgi:hypothetical protein